jgi:hypothetical protein
MGAAISRPLSFSTMSSDANHKAMAKIQDNLSPTLEFPDNQGKAVRPEQASGEISWLMHVLVLKFFEPVLNAIARP